MSRDSLAFKLLPPLAIVLSLAAQTITNPADYGLTPVLMKWISLLSTIMAAVTGWLGTSPLPGKNDANFINGAK